MANERDTESTGGASSQAQGDTPSQMADATVDGATPERPEADRRGTIPQRLRYLFDTVAQPNGRPYPASEVARWVSAHGGKISGVYITKILNGNRGKEPNPAYMRMLARFFEVSPSFFYDDDPADIDGQHHSSLIMLRDPVISGLLRNFSRLTPTAQDGVSHLIASLAADNHPELVDQRPPAGR